MAWDLMQLIPNLMKAYTNIIPITVFWGIITSILCIGMWRRNRSVRLVLVVFTICSGVMFYGLSIVVPGNVLMIGQVLTALGMAGIALTFIKK